MKSQPSFVDLALATPQPKPPTPAVCHGSEPENLLFAPTNNNKTKEKNNKQTPPDQTPGEQNLHWQQARRTKTPLAEG
jgi:hypothetical protein